MEEKKTCCFTGHRPQSLPFRYNENDIRCVKLKQRLYDEILRMISENNISHFISGMALGVDTYAAEIVLELKKQWMQIILECAIPCENQSEKWKERDRDRYFGIIEKCDKETLLQTQYTSDCMEKRNKYIVDHSDYVIAVWDGSPSGTGKTVRYAQAQNKPVIIINPNEL